MPKPQDQTTDQKDDSRRPQGVRLDGYFGHGLLRPGVGKIVQRSGEQQYCGSMAVRVFGYEENPSKFDANRISRRYVGEFYGIRYDGSRITSASGYVPNSIDGALKAMLDGGHNPASFAGEVWCFPDEEGSKTPLGYRYVVYDRRPRGMDDPLLQLAAAAGIVTPPSHQLPAPAVGEIDPETGEIT